MVGGREISAAVPVENSRPMGLRPYGGANSVNFANFAHLPRGEI